MNKFAMAAAGLLATTFLTGQAIAADNETKSSSEVQGETMSGTQYGSVRNEQDFSGEIAGGYSVEDLLDRDLYSTEGENIGDIVDLLMNEDKSVDKAVVDVGGFLGMGEKRVAIDIAELTFAQGDAEITIDMTEEQLEALPAFEYENDSWWSMSGM